MSDDFPSGKEFYEAAREELGYEKNLLSEGLRTDGMGREEYEQYSMEVQHECRCDELSREIEVECGKAKEIVQDRSARITDWMRSAWTGSQAQPDRTAYSPERER